MGLPPGNSKFSNDASPVTTFFWQFPNMTATHTGVTAVAGTLAVAGGGTGVVTLNSNQVLLAGTTSTGPFTQVAGGTSGQVLTATGATSSPIWQTPGGAGTTQAFFQASSQVTTLSTGITSSSFTTFSNSPALTFTPITSGTYKIYSPISLEGSSNVVAARVFNTSGGATLLDESQATTYAALGTVGTAIDTGFAQSIYTLIAGTSYVFDIQGAAQSTAIVYTRGDIAPFYMFAEQVAVSSAGGSAFFQASSQVTTVSSAVTGGTFTTFSNSPALTFTPTVSGTYKVYSSTAGFSTPAASDVIFRVFNTSGSATLLQESQAIIDVGVSSAETNPTSMSVYTLIAGTSYQFDLQGKTGAGSGFLDGTVAPFYMFAEQVATGTAQNLVLGAFGSTPNANAASISASTLTLQPASGSFPGGVSTGAQTFAGSKTIGFNVADAITIGAASSTALHPTNGGMQLTTRTVTASTFTVDTTTTDRIIYTDSTSNAITITLPAPTNGRILVIQDKTGKAATNNITINPHAAETINGLSTFVIAANYNSCELTSDGTNWLAAKLPISGNSFLTSGTTYTTPVNITPQTRFKFTLIGGGGGAGGINTAADAAAGGGAGAAVIVQATGLSANTGYTIAIGGAGTAGASTPTAGGNGGITTINFLSSTYTAGGGTGANDTATSNGGAGGTATNAAGTGVSNIINMPGGGGGCASGVTTNGSGQGGSGFMGWGGQAVIAAGAGNAGTGYGGGGSGGKGAAAAGGAGASGCIVVEWWN